MSELRRSAEETKGRTLRTVFFGGGTPSLMKPGSVARIMEEIRKLWPVANDFEVTLEANPTSVEAERFRGFRDAGVSRISMGIQSLNDADLKALGRMHTVKEALSAFETARGLFPRVSFDLIYARQNQTAAQWQAELSRALELSLDHISAYQLTIEPGTAFGDRAARGRLKGLPDDTLSADLYEITQDLCGAAGLPAYEVSNHAADGYESRHNLIYWRYGDYIGIGPGAHGRLTSDKGRFATETHLSPALWLSAVESMGSGQTAQDALSATDQLVEYAMMSLRLSEGTDLNRLSRLGYTPPEDTLQDLYNLELLSGSQTRLIATPKGRMVLNGILRQLLQDVPT